MDSWHYAPEGSEKLGPISFLELVRKFESGELDVDRTLVWQKGMNTWVPARKIDLFEKADEQPPKITADQVENYLDEIAAEERNTPELGKTALVPVTYLPAWPYLILFVTGAVLFVFQILPHLEIPRGENITEAELEAANAANLAFARSPEMLGVVWPSLLVLFASRVYQACVVFFAWKAISLHEGSKPPMLVAVLTLIPIVSILWRFIAFRTWSQQWNRITAHDSSLKMPLTLFTVHFVLGALLVLFQPLALIFVVCDMLVTFHMCRALRSSQRAAQ